MQREPVVTVDLSAKIGPATSHWDEIDELREQHRYFWNDDANGYWVLTRYDDIREAFQSPETFGNHSIVATEPDPDYRFLPSHLDPPVHMKYRHVMNQWFAPKAVERMSPAITQIAADLVDEIAPAGTCDYTLAFGDRFPVRSFLHVMGLPFDDAELLVTGVRQRSKERVASEVHGSNQGMGGWTILSEYWSGILEQRRTEPADPSTDFVTHLMLSKIDDETLPDADIVDIMVTLTIGSLDTLKAQLGWCMYHLASNADDRRRVVESPDLVVTAVEEFLRAYPVVSMARKVKHDVDFHGCPMRAGDMVLLWGQAATRDPRVFPDAADVIIDRQPNRHIAFGASAHRCLGSHLARAQLQIALREWHRRIPEYELAGDERPLARGGQIALLELPLTWPTKP